MCLKLSSGKKPVMISLTKSNIQSADHQEQIIHNYILIMNPSSDGKILFIVSINHTIIFTLQIKSRDIQKWEESV